jgi:hypothetical protein
VIHPLTPSGSGEAPARELEADARQDRLLLFFFVLFFVLFVVLFVVLFFIVGLFVRSLLSGPPSGRLL